jgi:hypothetical protein
MMDANQTKTYDNQEGMDVDLKETKKYIKSCEAEMKSTVNAFQEKMDASIASRKDDREEIMSCQEKMEPCLECDEPVSEDIKACHEATEADTEKIESYPGMMQFIAEHQVAPKEEAVVKQVKGRKKRRRGRKPVAGRYGEPKELTRSDCGSGKKLAAACRKASSCATVAWRKRNLLRRIGTQENCGPHKILTAAGRRKDPECKNGIRDRGLKQQQRGSERKKDPGDRRPISVRKKRITSMIYRNTIELEIVKRAVGISIGLRKIRKLRKWVLCRGSLLRNEKRNCRYRRSR